jgi:hypothetical protein
MPSLFSDGISGRLNPDLFGKPKSEKTILLLFSSETYLVTFKFFSVNLVGDFQFHAASPFRLKISLYISQFKLRFACIYKEERVGL